MEFIEGLPLTLLEAAGSVGVRTVVVLSSDYWRYVTGLTVPVDGGYSIAL